MEQINPRGLNTPYDDAFKSVIRKCPRLTLFLINEIFYRTGLSEEEYTGQEKVVFLDKELPSLDGPGLEMDLRLLVYGLLPRRYHVECQSTPDGRIILRVVQHNMISALEEAEYDQACIRVRLDDSGILFLRSTRNTPDVMTVELSLPQNQTVTYQIPVIKMQDYTLDNILEKRLFILLPFMFFNYERQLQQAKYHQEVYRQVQKLFDEILAGLQQQAEAGVISAYEASTLFDALKIVLEALGQTNQANKEVEKIMGGKVLTFSADKYFEAGKAEGKAEGADEEKIRTLWGLVVDDLLALDVAADRANLSVRDFKQQGAALMGEPVTRYIANQP